MQDITFKCIKYHCKDCKDKEQCEDRQKQEHLTFRPFENIKAMLEVKRDN